MPVPLNSSNITSSILLPVSTSADASIVKLPPSRIFLAAPKKRFGICKAAGLDHDEQEAVDVMRKAFNGAKQGDAVESVLNMFARTRNNREALWHMQGCRIKAAR